MASLDVFLSAVAVSTSLFLLIVLARQHKLYIGGFWLMAYVLCLLGLSCGSLVKAWFPAHQWNLPLETILLLLGPCYKIYLDRVTGAPQGKTDWLSFMPGLLLTLWAILIAGGFKTDSLDNLALAFWLIAPLQTIGYLIWCGMKLRSHRDLIRKQESNIARMDLAWLGWLLAASFLLWLFWLLSELTQWMWASVVNQIGITILAYGFAIGGWRQQQIPAASLSEVISSNGYQKSGLTELRASRLKDKLHHLMQSELRFTDPLLSLRALAQSVGESPQNLSRYFNEYCDTSFYDYINGLRASEMARRLHDPAYQHMNTLEVAMCCGFNAKSTMHQAFRKAFGCTPAAYRKQKNQLDTQ